MNTTNWKTFYAGMGIYAAFIVLVALPIYPQHASIVAIAQLLIAAVMASALVAIARLSGLSARLGDPDAVFIQTALGIAICCGFYSLAAPLSVPALMAIMFALWASVGMPHLSRRGVLALATLFFAAYLSAFTGALLDVQNPQRPDAILMAVVAIMMTVFLYVRAADYEYLHNLWRTKDAALEEAESRIHEFTTQDSETTALKYQYFRNQLIKEKARVDRKGGTFSVGLVEIDRYDEMVQKIGETATGQVLREFTERATRLIGKMGVHAKSDANYKPLGRMSGGRFCMILPGAHFADAMRCAERLHAAVDFKSIRTTAGIVAITLSIGVTEYAMPESVDDVMELATRALTLAQQHNGNDFKGLKRPRRSVTTERGLEEWNAHVVNR